MNALFFKFSRLGKKMFLNIPVSTSTAENPGSVRSVPFPVVVADFLSFVHEKYCESFVSQQDIKDYKYSGGFCIVSKFLPKDFFFFWKQLPMYITSSPGSIMIFIFIFYRILI